MIALKPATMFVSVVLFITYDLELNNGDMMLTTIQVKDNTNPVMDRM